MSFNSETKVYKEFGTFFPLSISSVKPVASLAVTESIPMTDAVIESGSIFEVSEGDGRMLGCFSTKMVHLQAPA